MDALQGLNCPKCGGIVPIPEGQVIVRCPYCDLRSVVRGQQGVRRYQVVCRTDREQAAKAMYQFLGSKMAIARDCKKTAQINEAFLAYLPFWMAWGRALGWVFGEKQVGSGDHKRYEPRENKIAEDMTWNGAACDVGEFGVSSVGVTDQLLRPFNPDELHRAGLVFEPAGSTSDASAAAEREFQNRITKATRLDRVSQVISRIVRQRLGMVYFPLWVMRYAYKGRTYQVVADGVTGKVLYGKAPGNTIYRAAVLVGGMALGALLAVDGPALVLSSASSDSDNPLVFALILLVAGLGIMWAAYRAFRYGEQYEYRSQPKSLASVVGMQSIEGQLPSQLGDVIRKLGDLS